MLPPLRDEIQLHPAPAGADGAPVWTLHDPTRNRFFRIGWPVFEILARWHLGDPDAIADSVAAETTLTLDDGDVEQVVRFLAGSELLRLASPADTARLVERVQSQKQTWGQWLLHHYLFFRVPLVRPDRFLAATLRHVAWVATPGFGLATLAAFVSGMFLIIRQWDVFAATLVDTFTVTGLAWYGVTLAGVKAAHELGHGYACKRLGCRVPTMGLAFLVMMPVLYTDTNEAWKLTRRRDRVAVAASGVLVELSLGVWATLAWGLLPDGPARGAAFMLATTTWISSLLVNLSPFMRFDGYFLLMDGLDMPNLHNRAFAIARWWLREALFAIDEPPPETFPRARRLALVAFAFAVWIYRLTLFLGIAALVYHFFIKAVGIGLFIVEMGWFVTLPIWHEVTQWAKRRHVIVTTKRSWVTFAVFGAVVLAAVVPWYGRVSAPAMLKAPRHVDLFVPLPGRVEQWRLVEGGFVAEGDTLAALSAPDLDHQLTQVAARIRVQEYELAAVAFDAAFRERAQALRQELEGAVSERDSLERQKKRMTLTAPFAGRVVDVTPDIDAGQWIGPKERLGELSGDGAPVVEAYVGEDDVARLEIGAEGQFLADDPGRAAVACRVAAVDRSAVRNFTEAALASTGGGPVAVRAKERTLVPERALYRIRCATGVGPLSAEQRGQLEVAAARESLVGRALRSAAAVLMRESGM